MGRERVSSAARGRRGTPAQPSPGKPAPARGGYYVTGDEAGEEEDGLSLFRMDWTY